MCMYSAVDREISNFSLVLGAVSKIYGKVIIIIIIRVYWAGCANFADDSGNFPCQLTTENIFLDAVR